MSPRLDSRITSVRGVGGDFKGVAGISVSVDDRVLASTLGRGNVTV
jgi:hypothetical protein